MGARYETKIERYYASSIEQGGGETADLRSIDDPDIEGGQTKSEYSKSYVERLNVGKPRNSGSYCRIVKANRTTNGIIGCQTDFVTMSDATRFVLKYGSSRYLWAEDSSNEKEYRC